MAHNTPKLYFKEKRMTQQRPVPSLFVLSLLSITVFALTACGSGQSNQMTINSGNMTMVSAPGTYDNKICEMGLAKAKELDIDPVCVFSNNGTLSIVPGYTVQIRNNSYWFDKNNLVTNAGQGAVSIGGVTISTGEMAVWQNSKFVKMAQ